MSACKGNHIRLAPIPVLVLLAFGPLGVVNGQGSTDATLKGLTVSPVDIVGFDSTVTSYHIGLPYSVTQVTITATAMDGRATIQIGKSRTDGNTVASGSGHSVSLVEGLNPVYISVTSSDGNTTKTHWINVGRGVESAFGWKAVDDFNTLYAAGNRHPAYIWSDGTTMWVTDGEDGKLYGYDMQTKARNEVQDFDTLIAAGIEAPGGISSDGETMWVTGPNQKLYAFDLSTKARIPTRDLDFSHLWGIRSILSDGMYMYATTKIGTVARYDLKNDEWDYSLPSTPSAGGLWSDGETLWFSNSWRYRLQAIDLATKELNPDKDFNTLEDAGCIEPLGIWSDGSTMWVVMYYKIFSFNMPTASISYDSDGDGLIEIGSLAQLNAVR